MKMRHPQVQFIHLVRLAWDLHDLGLESVIKLARSQEPAVEIPKATYRLKIMATRRGRKWVFTWGRGRDQWVQAEATDAAKRIAGVAAR